MQTCSQCNVELNEKTGYIKYKNVFQSRCRSCFNTYCIERWRQIKENAVEYKGGCCVYCGYNKNNSALEFHHLDPTQKDGNWTEMRKKSWDKIKKELDKCILLCSNCHREEHDKLRLTLP
jgi:hypothetical protein